MKKITKKIFKEKRAKLEKLRLKHPSISSMKTMSSFKDLKDMKMEVGNKHHANDYNYAPELVKKLKVMQKKAKLSKKQIKLEKKKVKKMKLETKKVMKKFEDK